MLFFLIVCARYLLEMLGSAIRAKHVYCLADLLEILWQLMAPLVELLYILMGRCLTAIMAMPEKRPESTSSYQHAQRHVILMNRILNSPLLIHMKNIGKEMKLDHNSAESNILVVHLSQLCQNLT